MTKFLQFAKRKSSLGLLIFSILFSQYVNSQCAFNANPYGGTSAPTTIGATNNASTCSFLGEYSPITAFLSSNVYTIAVNTPSFITIFNTSNVAVAWGASPLSFTPPANGTYNCQWNTSTGCGSVSNCYTTSVTLVGPSAACTNPANGGTSTSNPTAACPGQSINLSLTGSSTGSSLTYQWQSSPNGTTYTNIPGATNASYSLVQSTSTYYRCLVTCSAGTPATSIPVQVNMNSFINCYCTSNATQAFDEEILNVTIGSLTNASSCGVTGGPGSTNSLYSNYTNVTPALPIPNLTQGFVYPFSVGVGTCGGNFNNMVKAWIDYNQNGLFTDPGEEIYTSPTYINGVYTINSNITIPLTATPGNTRMRVVLTETTVSSGVNPCGTYGYGETEDYFVNIAVPLAEDAGITGFINPAIPTCSFNDSVSVTLKNFGTDTLTSVNINWSLNGVNITPSVFWTGSLAPLASTNVTLGMTIYASGDNMCAWTTNPNGVIENPAGSYNDSSCLNGLLPGLSGIYTIGGTTPDFANMPSAIAALNFAGVCGPTTFNLRSGTYYDQVVLGNVLGASAVNTITFRSEDGHRDSVIIDYGTAGSTNNYIVLMNNADYFHFESMTLRNPGASYGRVFDIQGGSNNNRIFDCKLQTQSTNTTSNLIAVIFSAGANDNYNTFENNSIIGGSFGAYMYGSGITSLEIGTTFKNNQFVDNYYMGLYMYYAEAAQVIGNRFYGVSTYTSRYGIYTYYVDKASKFTHNSIESNATSFWYYGMYLNYMDATSAGRGLISNNDISVGTPGSASGVYGIYLYYSGFFDLHNNSVNVAGGSTNSYAFYISNGGANNLKNNTFTNFGGGRAVYVVGAYALNEMDYNNLFTTGTILAYYDGLNCAAMSNWQSASGADANGLNIDPGYYSAFDLHVCSDLLNGAGTPLALVTDDMDGQPRNATTPDIGADEFSPLTSPGFIGPDALVCTGQTVNLYAGSPTDNILWSTGDTTSLLVVSAPGTYTVTVIGACGTAFDTVIVTNSTLTYTGFLNASQTEFCTGGSALLTSTMPANTYSWTGGSSNDSLVVTTSGPVTLIITDACGSGSETVVITVNTAPIASFTINPSFLSGGFVNTTTGGGGATTYSWNFGDGATSTDMSPSHIYTSIGTFTVTLTVTNACGTSTATNTITTTTTGLEEIEGVGTIAVYPNPSNGIFQIDFNMNNDINIDIRVTNILGESVYVKNLGSINGTHNDAIDITTAAPGVYYITVISDNNVVMTNKLVKQ